MFEKIYDASMRLVEKVPEDKQAKLDWWGGFLTLPVATVCIYFFIHHQYHMPFDDLSEIYIWAIPPSFFMFLWIVGCGLPPK